MKKSLTRKLLLSVATLALALTSFVTTTVAWFTVNTEAKANALTITGASSQDTSLLVSTDGIQFYAAVTPELTPGYGSALKDVQCYYVNSGSVETPNNAVTFAGIKTVAEEYVSETSTAGYARWSLYFQTPNDTGKNVVLKSCTLINTTPTINPWTCNTAMDGLFTIGTNYYFDALNCGRLGIEVYKTKAWSDAGVSYTGFDSTSFSRYYLGSHTNTANQKPSDATFTVSGTTPGYGRLGDPDGLNALSYYNNVLTTSLDPADISVASLTTAESYVDVDATAAYVTGSTSAATPITTTGDAGTIARVDFYFWLEGWDKDCFDGITKSGQTFSVQMSFCVAE